MIKWILLKILQGYKKYISPHLGDNCRFKPTCSEYAIQALEIHSLLKALLLIIWRLGRCNPFGKVGYDPVPPKGYWKNKQKHVWKE